MTPTIMLIGLAICVLLIDCIWLKLRVAAIEQELLLLKQAHIGLEWKLQERLDENALVTIEAVKLTERMDHQ